MDIETITIVTENGPVRINKTDYKPSEHVLVGEEKAKAAVVVDAPKRQYSRKSK